MQYTSLLPSFLPSSLLLNVPRSPKEHTIRYDTTHKVHCLEKHSNCSPPLLFFFLFYSNFEFSVGSSSSSIEFYIIDSDSDSDSNTQKKGSKKRRKKKKTPPPTSSRVALRQAVREKEGRETKEKR